MTLYYRRVRQPVMILLQKIEHVPPLNQESGLKLGAVATIEKTR
jgi:hypothetical protein